jgi:Tfp pilus assembly protein PilF
VTACVLALSLVAQIGSQPASRESAYRHNNIGVAYLEQYNFEAAAASFRTALEQDASLAIARLNLGIALFYAGQHDAATTELERARDALPGRPHADYVLGLIARAANRLDDAVAAFSRAQTIDATDAGIAINIGQLHLQQRRYADALASFRTAEAAEPYNATAVYGLATALIRSGAADQGKAAMGRFEKLRESTYATTFSQAYLEQGRYAEAIASTGAEPGLVDERTPDVAFTEATAAIFPQAAALTPTGGPLALFDLDGDGDLDLADGGARALRVYRNDRGTFADVSASTVPAGIGANGIVAGDSDNDGDADLLVFATGRAQLLRHDPGHRFVAVADGGLPQTHSVQSAAWLDADHDGDLDLILTGLDPQKMPAAYLLQNSGSGQFTDVTGAAAITVARGGVVAALPTDFDNRRDVDILMVPGQGPPALFRNLRDGSFRDVASDVGVALDGNYSSIAAGDINKDNYPDFFLGARDRAGRVFISDGRARFTASDAPAATAHTLASQFLDYDNDGLLDLLVLTADGPRLLRSLGSRWEDVSAQAFTTPWPARVGSIGAIASGDIDGDGDVDVMMRSVAGLTFFRNDGGSRARSVRVQLTSRVSNRSAIGTKIEIRAGSLRQRLETYATSAAPAPADLVFGLGTRAGADVARVLWPSGILQAETATGDRAASGLSGALRIEELDRKPSSCPYLFTWNGSRFEFVTDFLGGGEMGYWQGPGVRNTPDPDEYVRIEGPRLQPRNGRYELRVTNELEEAVFLDRAELVAIAHPADVEVHPNEGLRSTPGPFTLYRVRDVRPPAAVVDDHGHDVLDRVTAIDRRYPDDFPLERIRGYAAEHSLTIALPAAGGDRQALLLTGWTDYAFSGDNVAAHQLGLRMLPPSLQIERAGGGWETVIGEIGFPVGRPQTVVVDLSGKLGAARRVRITTTMRIYWDRIQVGTIDPRTSVLTTRLPAVAADLRWRGFSTENTPDGREPHVFDYDRVSPRSPWKVLTGRYTREGDVRELVLVTDDRFVVGRTGDEIALSFDATRLPPLPEGWTRTFLLFADGFSKEMNLNSASPDRVEPMPYHGMAQYPYPAAATPSKLMSPSYRDYVSRYNTRVVPRSVPPLELIAGQRNAGQ